MAIALGQHTKFNLSTAAAGTSSALTTASGRTFVVGYNDPNTTGTVTDSKGNTYTRIGVRTAVGAGSTAVNLFRCENGIGGSGHTATLTFSSGTGDCAVYFAELTGVPASSFDQNAQGNDTAGPNYDDVTTPTLAQAAELVLTIAGTDSNPVSWTETTGMTLVDEETDGGLFWTSTFYYKIVASTAGYAPVFTVGNAVNGVGQIVATFKEASAASSQAPRSASMQMILRNNN